MAASAAAGLQIATARPSIASPHQLFRAGTAFSVADLKGASWAKLTSTTHISSLQPLQRQFSSLSMKSGKAAIRAMTESSEKSAAGLPIDLKGQTLFSSGHVNSLFTIGERYVCSMWNADLKVLWTIIICPEYWVEYNIRNSY